MITITAEWPTEERRFPTNSPERIKPALVAFAEAVLVAFGEKVSEILVQERVEPGQEQQLVVCMEGASTPSEVHAAALIYRAIQATGGCIPGSRRKGAMTREQEQDAETRMTQDMRRKIWQLVAAFREASGVQLVPD